MGKSEGYKSIMADVIEEESRMTPGEKLEALARHFGLNIKELSERCGYVRPQALYDVTSGKTRNVSPKMANKIFAAFPQVNRAWLLQGEGRMLLDAEGASLRVDQHVPVPLYDMDALGAGGLDTVGLGDAGKIRAVVTFGKAMEGDIALTASDPSMAPTLPVGSIMLLRRVHDWREYFGFGSIYVLGLADGRIITKEVVRCQDNPRDCVWVESHNPRFPGEELPKSMIKSVWKVIKVQADVR